MFRRPAWATTSSNSNISSSAAASASGSFTLPGASIPRDDASSLERRPSSSDSLFRHAARTHDAVVTGLAARRRKEAPIGKEQRTRADRGSGEKRKSIADQEGNSVERHMVDEPENTSTPLKNEACGESGWSPTNLKKRRIGADDVKALLVQAGFEPVNSDGDEDQIQGAQLQAQEESDTKAKPITIEDDDQNEAEDHNPHTQDAQPAPNATVLPEEDDESDPELLELRRKARERHKRAEGRSTTPVTSTTSVLTSKMTHDPDPIVHILITSPIPNTNPLIVQRKLSQRLQEVRLAWCQKQGFTEDVVTKVFLMFRGRRKYDVTAVKSLGLEVDALGTVTMRNGDFGEEVDRVHLEAMTDEILAKQRADMAKSLQREMEGGAVVAEEEEGEPLEQQQLIRLVIKAKGQKDFKLRVKSDTVVSKIVTAARREFKTPNDGTAYLEFDGEQLNSKDRVKDTEIEDMMCLDFYSS